MSITVSSDVFCDGDGCSIWVEGVTGPRSDAVNARKNAKRRYGWTITRNGDFCPPCAAERNLVSKDPAP